MASFRETGCLGSISQKWYRIAFVTIVAIAAFAFVVWQLRQRRFAANVVEASTRILTRLGSGEAITLFDARDYNGLLLPHFFVDELVTVAEARSGIRGAGVSELITYATMVLAAILVALQLIG